MPTSLLPQAFWFRLAIPCVRIDRLSGPVPSRAKWLDLPPDTAMPSLAALDGKEPWAEVRVAWNPAGLALQVETRDSPAVLGSGERPEGMDGVHVWVDTRDTRNVSRATRFCHRFNARVHASGPRSPLRVDVEQRPIARAVADAPLCRPESLAARVERLKGGWRLELFLAAEALHGFDPETNRRLGFAYQVTDPDREDQFLGVGREFPVGENPSLWSTLELRD